jgi:hypothetical protein
MVVRTIYLCLLAWFVFCAAVFILLPPVRAHEATNVQGQPLGITYPSGCCNSAATAVNGDCAPIDEKYVTERPDGYHIDLPAGAHPQLKEYGYSGIVPYKDVKQPVGNDYHICLAHNGSNRYCFFPKPGAA